MEKNYLTGGPCLMLISCPWFMQVEFSCEVNQSTQKNHFTQILAQLAHLCGNLELV